MGNVKKKSESNFLLQGSILAIAGLISRFIGMIYRIPMTNALGDEGLAYYDNAFQIYNLALIISSYGLPLAVSRMVAAKTTKKEYKNAYKLFGASFIFATLSGGIMATIIFVFAEDLSMLLFNTPYCALPLRILAPTIFLCALMGVFRGYFQGNSTMIPTAISQLIEQIINAIVSVVATYTFIKYSVQDSFYAICDSKKSWGAAGGTLGTCLGALSGLIVLIAIFIINKSKINEKLSSDTNSETDSYKDIYKVMFLTILPVILGQILYNLNSIVDRTCFSHLVPGDSKLKQLHLGRYGKYYLLISIPIAVATALGNSIIPTIVKEHVNGNKEGLRNKISAAIKFNMIIAIPSAVGLSVLGRYIIESLFPGTDPMVARFLMYASITVVFYTLSTTSNAVLQGIGLMRFPLIHSAISFVLHLIVVVILLKTGFGIDSIVVGNGVFAFFVCLFNNRKIAKTVDYKQEVKKTFAIPFVCSLIMGAFSFIVATVLNCFNTNNSTSVTRIITLIALFVAVIAYFVAMVALKGLTESEIKRFPMGNKLVMVMKKVKLM